MIIEACSILRNSSNSYQIYLREEEKTPTMDDDNPVRGIMIILILLILNMIFTSVKAAFENVNESGVKKKAENGDQRAVKLLKLLDKPDGYQNALELLYSLNFILLGITFTTHLLNRFQTVLINSGLRVNENVVKPGYYILLTALLVFMLTLLGTVLPKKIAQKHAETLSYQLLGLICLIGFLLKPVTWLMDKTLNVILFIFGIKPSELTDNVTEEEFISLVNEGHEQGVFDAGEVEMISNIIELDGKEAQDIMTHKIKIVAVNSEMTVEQALRFMLTENYSRYPLYEDNRDNIIGILHLKDVIIAYISEDLKNKPLKEISREPYFVPDTQNISILFHDMQSKNIHMAIVIDEYGQTAGLVALEDFLEEIVGNILDEYDEEEKFIIAVEENTVIVKGSISLEELEDDLNIVIDHEDFDTLNGLLISLLDRIPGDGEKANLDYKGYDFEILETKNKMIEQVRISKLPDHQDEPNSGENI
jgi:putative hemolysin